MSGEAVEGQALQRVWVETTSLGADPAELAALAAATVRAGAAGLRLRAVVERGSVRLRASSGSRRRGGPGLTPPEWAAAVSDPEGSGGCEFAVEAADPTTASEVVETARSAGLLESLWVVSGDLESLLSVRASSPATRVLHACDPAREARGAEQHAARLRSEGLEGVLVAEDRASAGPVVLMHRFGRTVAVSGVDYPRHLRRARASGADIICGPDTAMLTSPG